MCRGEIFTDGSVGRDLVLICIGLFRFIAGNSFGNSSFCRCIAGCKLFLLLRRRIAASCRGMASAVEPGYMKIPAKPAADNMTEATAMIYDRFIMLQWYLIRWFVLFGQNLSGMFAVVGDSLYNIYA